MTATAGSVVMGVRHRTLPLEGVQFHPESILSEHGRPMVANWLGARMSDADDPAAFFADVADRHRRCFWLDGGGAREWSGRRSIIGWLDESDVSLTYNARLGRGDAARCRELRSRSARTSSRCSRTSSRRATESDQWFGYFGYAARPDLPAAVGLADARRDLDAGPATCGCSSMRCTTADGGCRQKLRPERSDPPPSR